jgi:hypothetical protein
MSSHESRIDGANTGRDESGRFVRGNPGGPGRPRRQVEADYLVALSDAVSIEDWKGICRRAVMDALDGDGKARDWLAALLLRDAPTLYQVSAREMAGIDGLETAALMLKHDDDFSRALTDPPPRTQGVAGDP